MTDREMLELAAKAAGLSVRWNAKFCMGVGQWERDARPVEPLMSEWLSWNPLADDGDALRLAVRLRLHIEWRVDGRVAVSPLDYVADIYITESAREDRYAATRRAIVRAAAEIGRAMP